MKTRLMLAFAGAALAGCGGAAPTPTQAEVQQARIQVAEAGPKLRVAVGQFGEMEGMKTLLESMGWKGMAPLISEQVVTGLTQSQRVTVLERSQIDKVIGNIKLEKESADARFFDQGTTTEIGKFEGAQLVFVGAITEFEPNVGGGDAGISVGSLGGLKYHNDKAAVGIDVRLVDQQTGKVMYAAHARSEVQTDEAGGAVGYKGIQVGGSAWSRTPLGEATRRAADDAIRQLVEALRAIPFEAPVVDVRDGGKVFVGAGRNANLKAGDRFQVVHRGEAITDAEGKVVGHDETAGGWVEIQSVQEQMAIAKLVEGEAPKKGDLVRLPLQ